VAVVGFERLATAQTVKEVVLVVELGARVDGGVVCGADQTKA
jgi:hypothetical protein